VHSHNDGGGGLNAGNNLGRLWRSEQERDLDGNSSGGFVGGSVADFRRRGRIHYGKHRDPEWACAGRWGYDDVTEYVSLGAGSDLRAVPRRRSSDLVHSHNDGGGGLNAGDDLGRVRRRE